MIDDEIILVPNPIFTLRAKSSEILNIAALAKSPQITVITKVKIENMLILEIDVYRSVEKLFSSFTDLNTTLA